MSMFKNWDVVDYALLAILLFGLTSIGMAGYMAFRKVDQDKAAIEACGETAIPYRFQNSLVCISVEKRIRDEGH